MEGKEKKNAIVFRKGKKVILRPLRKSTDLENNLRWINDPEVTKYLLVYLPVGEKEEGDWIDGAGKENPDAVHFAIETHDGLHIGNIGFHKISWRDRTAVTGSLIGEKEYWGKGYGTDAKMLLLDYAFNALNLRKVNASVLAFNERSIRYGLRCGYKEEGRRRAEFYRDGSYHDEVLLAIFKEDWLPIWETYQATGSVR